LEGGVQRYFGFLRAVNVGGRQLKMAELAQALTDLGLSEAETFIASGNVVFFADVDDVIGLQQRIDDGLSAHFGFPVEIFLRTRADLSDIVAQVEAATQHDDVAINVAMVHDGSDETIATALAPWQSASERFDVHRRYFLWLAKVKMSDTAFFKKGYTKKSMPVMTVRSYNTIARMLAKWGD
jgi:uncharacterized protein (DUF1697 family)